MKRLRAVSVIGVAGCLALLGHAASVSASGPVERMTQVLVQPSDPNVLVIRWGSASEGLLFSRDGGGSFEALCSTAIDGGLSQVSQPNAIYAPTAAIDGSGRVLIGVGEVWSDDGTGCAWTKAADLTGKIVRSLKYDPITKATLAVANVQIGPFDDLIAYPELVRQTPAGGWEVLGELKAKAEHTQTYGGDLLAAGTRLYATILSSTGPLGSPQVMSVVVSDDGGKSWRERALPRAQQSMTLLAVDPRDPERVLAMISNQDRLDQLLLSTDGATTFKPYGQVQNTSGVAFAPDGRLFISDAGEGAVPNATGGIFTAARLGEPLTRVPDRDGAPVDIDCVQYDVRTNKLRICKLHRFGELDWETGDFRELVRFESVKGLLACPGRDIHAVCEAQLNAGPAWCCSQHYPFTPFCGTYDVVRMNNRPVACGLTGRQTDIDLGLGPSLPQSADVSAAPMSRVAPALWSAGE